MSLEEGIVPSEWKEANVMPLFKKGSRNNSEHYRPVSLTSVVCKLLETLIIDHRLEFLVKHKLIKYTNDLEYHISSKVLKFADYTKVFRKVTNDTDKQRLQDHLDKLVK